jgi:hypothetical protein
MVRAGREKSIKPREGMPMDRCGPAPYCMKVVREYEFVSNPVRMTSVMTLGTPFRLSWSPSSYIGRGGMRGARVEDSTSNRLRRRFCTRFSSLPLRRKTHIDRHNTLPLRNGVALNNGLTRSPGNHPTPTRPTQFLFFVFVLFQATLGGAVLGLLGLGTHTTRYIAVHFIS